MSEPGYVICMATCWCCKHPFACNDHKVPSLRIDGVKQPLCRLCVETANTRRLALGQPPHFIHPDAYNPRREDE